MNLLDTLLPRYCSECAQRLKERSFPHLCLQCAKSLQPAQPKCIFCDTEGVFLCHFCKRLYPYLADVAICCQYQGLLKKLIKSFKYQLKPYLSATLTAIANHYADHFLKQLPENILTIPMPSDRIRMAQRGFNPPALIAKALAQQRNFAYSDQILEKRAFSLPQAHLSLNERLQNHYNSFILNERRYQKFYIQNQPTINTDYLDIPTIFFIDDVITTGSSFQRAMEILNNPQPKRVYALFIAQSPFEK